MDPFSLIAAGVGTAGALAGGIYNAATAKSRQRDFEKKAREQALLNLRRQRAAELGMPTYSLDAMAQSKAIDAQGAQIGKVDPMSFVPFVQQGANLAGQIYSAANAPSQQEGRLAPDPIARAQKAALDQQDALERAQAMQYFQQNGLEGYGRY